MVSLLFPGPSWAAEATLVPRDGQPYAAALKAIGADGRVTLSASGRPLNLTPAALVRYGAPAEPAAGPLVLLSDGGCLVVKEKSDADQDKRTLDALALRGEKLALDTRYLGRIELPVEQLRGLVLRRPARQLDADLLLDQAARAGARGDQVLLDNGDRVAGNLTALDGDKLQLEVEGRPVTIEVRNIVAVFFNPALARAPAAAGPRMAIGLADGSRLLCARAESEEDVLRLTTLGGTALTTTLARVVWLQPVGRDLVYLSDLKPAGYRHTPYLDLPWTYQRDRNVLGGQLRCGGHSYFKGLGMHSAAILSYALAQPYRRLDAELGIDDQTAGHGSVVLRVYVDTGDGQWQQRHESAIIRGGQRPVPISVDLSGAKRLGLLVDYADHGDELDHADWLDARLVP